MQRVDGRSCDQLRPLRISYNVFGYAPGSVLFELGDTKVLCAVTLQAGVPHFLKGKKVGWLTAEYAMLPTSTAYRSARESENGKRNGRSVEISRLIGRSLRTIVDLSLIGERTITIDCDVLQADGGTRTACITAASLALEQAQKVWLEQHIITQPILTDRLAAISLGLKEGHALLDLNFEEDSSIDADFNIVMTASGKLIEIQGSAEGAGYTWEQFEAVRVMAGNAIQKLFVLSAETTDPVQLEESPELHQKASIQEKVPLFSLKNRLTHVS